MRRPASNVYKALQKPNAFRPALLLGLSIDHLASEEHNLAMGQCALRHGQSNALILSKALSPDPLHQLPAARTLDMSRLFQRCPALLSTFPLKNLKSARHSQLCTWNAWGCARAVVHGSQGHGLTHALPSDLLVNRLVFRHLLAVKCDPCFMKAESHACPAVEFAREQAGVQAFHGSEMRCMLHEGRISPVRRCRICW